LDEHGSIRVLPKDLVNRIAAGEIVERPASVVKELIENALDADAARIVVNIRGGGLEEIVVTDDGNGIHPRDMLLAVQPHATSKLAQESDLWSIVTLGFRGEALASIAAISRMRIRSQMHDASEGASLQVQGGMVDAVSSWIGPPGTRVNVADLFFNTPVRLRHLGAANTETAHVSARVRELALGNPGVSFRLISKDRELVFTSGSGDFLQTIAEVYDAEFASNLLPLQTGENAIVGGYIGPPDFNRARRDRQCFLLNGRAITHPGFTAVLDRAYEGFIPAGRYPVAILQFAVRPDRVDVNVHPTKRRVRLQNERDITGRLYRSVQNALLGMKVKRWELPTRTDGQARSSLLREGVGAGEVANEQGQGQQLSYGIVPSQEVDLCANRIFDHLDPMGQVLDAYIVARGPRALYLIDQHAACERLYYDEALRLYDEHHAPVQQLVQPQVIELEAVEMDAWEQWKDRLGAMGFEVEAFGPDSLIVRAVPILAGEPAPPGIMHEILKRFSQDLSTTPSATRAALALAACRASVKSGDSMSEAEIRGLIARLSHLDTPSLCPHGRPTIVRIDRERIERLFERK